MLKNYIRTAWRNIRRNKLHSFINIMGLAIAFSVSIVLFLVVYFHLSFDSFHDGKSQLFRTSLFTNSIQGAGINSTMPLPLKAALENDIPDIETAVRIMGTVETISYQDKSIERSITRTDSEFFEMFNFPILVGDKTIALSNLQSVALNESTAIAIFGDANPLGKEIKIGRKGSEKSYTVSAIIKDAPRNSSIRFDAIARVQALDDYAVNNMRWDVNTSNIFIKLSSNSNSQLMQSKLNSLVEKYYPEQLAQLKLEHPEVKNTSDLMSLNLTNIEDIHFSGPKSAPLLLIYAIMALGAFILLIACFNFVNLNIAHAFKRSRELGVRKTLGAFKGQLFAQLWGEAFLLYFIGFVLGIVLATQLIPFFNSQFGGGINVSTLFEADFIAIIFGVFLMVTLIAGGYPALKMTNFNLVQILKGNVSTKKPGVLQNTLLVSQFAISSLLICVSIIAGQQLDFLRQKPIGFDKEQVVSIPVGTTEDGRKVLGLMRDKLAGDPSFVSVTGSKNNLGRGKDRRTSTENVDFIYNQNQIFTDWVLADFDYLKTLGIPLVQGRDFSRNFATDSVNAVIVSESFVKAMGEKNPIGKFFGGETSTSGNRIIGVVSDFNVKSPSAEELPIVIHLSASEAINYIFVKTRSDNPQLAIQKLSSAWEEVTSGSEFKGSFLDENLQAWYEVEKTMTTIFGLASTIAIFLSCLGLFAISLLVIESRTKEIGIRKVMGASVNNVVGMISFHFLKLVLVSLLLALPIAWFIAQSWVENYEYQMAINPLTFILVGILVALVALVTVGFHTIKAALTNPVICLRTE
ncbi:FtsX-like permease family protein [Flagellimonas sp.]|uniref:ABC transporter permease n=1 Tax=Flagellimonas sp. TaxID=2058762 RepID=UPI003B59C00B